MAHLVGINLPVNSVGEIPLTYLKADERNKAEAAFTNARQILEQYEVKHSKTYQTQIRKTLELIWIFFWILDEKERDELFFRPFGGLSGANHPDIYTAEILALIENEQYTLAEEKSRQLMTLSLEGLRYFQTYDWLFLRGIVTLGYVGWCVFCLQFVIANFVLSPKSQTNVSIKSQVMVRTWQAILFCVRY